MGTEQRTIGVDEILKSWRLAVGSPPDVIGLKFTKPVIGPAGRAIDIRLRGSDLAALKSASLDLRAWLGAYEGVADLSDDLRPGKPELQLRLREGATALGLNAQMIATQLRAAFFGKTAAEIQLGPEAYEVDVRLAQSDKNSLGDLEYFSVTGGGGAQIPLGEVPIWSGAGVSPGSTASTASAH